MQIRRPSGHLLTAPLLLAACFEIAPLPGELAHAARPVERQDWTVGLAYGVGHATVDLSEPANSLDWSRGGSPQMRVGRMLGQHFMIGIEDRQWLNEGGLADSNKVRGNIQNFSLVLTAYPGRTTDMTSGIFLQLGGGYAHGRLSALEPFEGGSNEWGETYEVVYKHDAGGWGAMVGAGYEFCVSRHFAVGVSVSYNIVRFDDTVFQEVQFFPGGLNLNWYF